MSNVRRIIFLDVDGVLNCSDWYDSIAEELQKHREYNIKHHFNPDAVKLLNQLECAEVVISSSWGYSEDVVNVLKESGLLLPIIGGTVHLEMVHNYLCRGNSIAKYLNEELGLNMVTYSYSHGNWSEERNGVPIIKFVIFDDNDDFLICQAKNLVQTDNEHGLTQDHIDKAKKILDYE